MAFVGGTLFEIGSYLMYVESLNTGHEELFGKELLGLVEGKAHTQRIEDVESSNEKGQSKRRFRWWYVLCHHNATSLAQYITQGLWIIPRTRLPRVLRSDVGSQHFLGLHTVCPPSLFTY